MFSLIKKVYHFFRDYLVLLQYSFCFARTGSHRFTIHILFLIPSPPWFAPTATRCTYDARQTVRRESPATSPPHHHTFRTDEMIASKAGYGLGQLCWHLTAPPFHSFFLFLYLLFCFTPFHAHRKKVMAYIESAPPFHTVPLAKLHT